MRPSSSHRPLAVLPGQWWQSQAVGWTAGWTGGQQGQATGAAAACRSTAARTEIKVRLQHPRSDLHCPRPEWATAARRGPAPRTLGKAHGPADPPQPLRQRQGGPRSSRSPAALLHSPAGPALVSVTSS